MPKFLVPNPPLRKFAAVEARQLSRFETSSPNVRSQFRGYHEFAVTLLISAAVALELTHGPLDVLTFPFGFAAVVLVLGLPHGALDVEIACERYDLRTRRELAVLLFVYVGLAAAVILAWTIAPAAALGAFLLISSFHFGGDWYSGVPKRLVTGCAVLTAPAIYHSSQVAEIFGWLVPQSAAVRFTGDLAFAALPLVVMALALAYCCGTRWVTACEITAVIAGAVILPPLTFFALYFCLLHSVRHLAQTVAELPGRSLTDHVRAGLPFAAVAIGSCLLGATAFVSLAPGPAMISSVFVGLAALTVPHMVLIDTLPERYLS